MTDALERNATVTAVVAGLIVALYSGTGFALSFGLATWHIALYVATLAALVVTIGLALLVVAPDHPRTTNLPQRPALLLAARVAF